jgi:dTDP-4-dehydrorhamnose 3,5-epimerase
MEIIKTEIEELILLKMPSYEDLRGRFIEVYHSDKFEKIIGKHEFVQDNESISHKHVLRGLHFQVPPFAQGKLVRVSSGSVLDVAVDLRRNSLTYGKYKSVVLSDENKLMMWIPPGFAHGFVALEEKTIFAYKCTALYNPDSECSVLWNDPDLNINWGVENPLVSDKDGKAMLFKDLNTPF